VVVGEEGVMKRGRWVVVVVATRRRRWVMVVVVGRRQAGEGGRKEGRKEWKEGNKGMEWKEGRTDGRNEGGGLYRQILNEKDAVRFLVSRLEGRKKRRKGILRDFE
jgi:hypothetical protein